jgi:hypothetical protein
MTKIRDKLRITKYVWTRQRSREQNKNLLKELDVTQTLTSV